MTHQEEKYLSMASLWPIREYTLTSDLESLK